MKLHYTNLIVVLIECFLVSFSAVVRADFIDRNTQLHYRSGMVNGSYSVMQKSGALSDQFSVIPSHEFEFEKFTTPKSSYLLSVIMALDVTTARMSYFFSGIGQRFFFKARGYPVHRSEHGLSLDMVGKSRYFVGWSVGIAQVSMTNVGVFVIQSTLLDIGLNGGYVWPFSESFDIETILGLNYGYGFSDVAASGMSTRFMIGIGYNF